MLSSPKDKPLVSMKYMLRPIVQSELGKLSWESSFTVRSMTQWISLMINLCKSLVSFRLISVDPFNQLKTKLLKSLSCLGQPRLMPLLPIKREPKLETVNSNSRHLVLPQYNLRLLMRRLKNQSKRWRNLRKNKNRSKLYLEIRLSMKLPMVKSPSSSKRRLANR